MSPRGSLTTRVKEIGPVQELGGMSADAPSHSRAAPAADVGAGTARYACSRPQTAPLAVGRAGAESRRGGRRTAGPSRSGAGACASGGTSAANCDASSPRSAHVASTPEASAPQAARPAAYGASNRVRTDTETGPRRYRGGRAAASAGAATAASGARARPSGGVLLMGRAGLAAVSILGLLVGGACLCAAMLGASIGRSATADDTSAVPGIPADYLHAYREASVAFGLGDDGWSYLAAIGEIESDHGRSEAAGVHAGQNANGCCAGPMQIHNGFGSGGGTWGAYATDGDGDGSTDIYSPADAAATAAHYLRASGAPADWRRAIFAYNHAGWYVDRVFAQARAYQAAGLSVAAADTGSWLVALPSFPGERCDARIVPEVERLALAYGLRVTDCYGGWPHETRGEHPLGLAVDWVPIDGDWRRTKRLAVAAGWRPACARAGCPAAGPFRVVLYNGYPGHGDPAHSASAHLHTSWAHGPARAFSRAPWVRLVLAAP